MLCERCKIREANIQYTEVINGVKKDHHFCAQCARELDFGPYSAIFDSEFPLGKLLSGLLGIGEEQQEEKDKAHQVVCPTCRTSYDEFIKNSRFGCPDCYSVFDLLISDNIKQLQGSECHKGKQPKFHREHSEAAEGNTEDISDASKVSGSVMPKMHADGPAEQIRILEAKLQEALKREEYETAAQCRDRIRELKEGIERC